MQETLTLLRNFLIGQEYSSQWDWQLVHFFPEVKTVRILNGGGQHGSAACVDDVVEGRLTIELDGKDTVTGVTLDSWNSAPNTSGYKLVFPKSTGCFGIKDDDKE